MSAIEVTARKPNPDGDDREVTVSYDFGDNLSEMVDLYGEDVSYNRAKASMVIDLQARLRAWMTDNLDKEGNVVSKAKDDDEIIGLAAEWKPGIKKISRKSPKEKLLDMLKEMSPEDRAKFLAEAAEAA